MPIRERKRLRPPSGSRAPRSSSASSASLAFWNSSAETTLPRKCIELSATPTPPTASTPPPQKPRPNRPKLQRPLKPKRRRKSERSRRKTTVEGRSTSFPSARHPTFQPLPRPRRRRPASEQQRRLPLPRTRPCLRSHNGNGEDSVRVTLRFLRLRLREEFAPGLAKKERRLPDKAHHLLPKSRHRPSFPASRWPLKGGLSRKRRRRPPRRPTTTTCRTCPSGMPTSTACKPTSMPPQPVPCTTWISLLTRKSPTASWPFCETKILPRMWPSTTSFPSCKTTSTFRQPTTS
mmetsp:Transcript_16771/g.50848  ORF Transcript_16771/g.50848 Transcript_16771/m.50848 type:complete len:291 (+) Transcript_16771:1056-1928(+)